jgi:hypothetical protein
MLDGQHFVEKKDLSIQAVMFIIQFSVLILKESL